MTELGMTSRGQVATSRSPLGELVSDAGRRLMRPTPRAPHVPVLLVLSSPLSGVNDAQST
jgi:hypothetical protein